MVLEGNQAIKDPWGHEAPGLLLSVDDVEGLRKRKK